MHEDESNENFSVKQTETLLGAAVGIVSHLHRLETCTVCYR
jgi:hypothetical protein